MGNLLFSNKIAFLSKVFISCFIRKIQYSGKNHLLLKIGSPLVVGGSVWLICMCILMTILFST